MDHITLPWPGWEIVEIIGAGGFGTVYEIVRRNESGSEEHAALKIVSVPHERDEINSLRMEGYDDASIADRYKEYANRINKEYYLQKELKGNSHIVSVEDNKIVPHKDGLGQDIFIRMELLHTMREILNKKRISSDAEVIRLGKEMCEALIVCQGRSIIHRDIKPDNIFRNDTGDWKLGDFGIARTMEHTTTATKAGTYGFMAPEVYHGEKYSREVDIYSLGMVLYWLLNNRRKPFLPTDHIPKPSEEEAARIKRFSGKYPIPEPLNGSAGLKRIVLKACSFNPKDRYASAREMYKDLLAVESEIFQGSSPTTAGETQNDHSAVPERNNEDGYKVTGDGNETEATAGSISDSGEGISQGNGWEKDATGTIGNPHRPAGGGNKDTNTEDKTEGAYKISEPGPRKKSTGEKEERKTDPVPPSPEPSAQKTGGSGKIYLLFGLSAIVIIMVSAWFLSNSGGESSTGTGSSNTVSSNTVSSENNNGYETDVNDTDSEGDDYISEPGLIDPFLGDGWASFSMDIDQNGNNVPYFTAVIYDGYIEKKYADGGTDTELIYEVVEDDEGINIRMCDGTAYFAQQGSFDILWLCVDNERKSDNMSASDSLYRISNTSSNNNYIETQSSDTGSNEYTPEQLRQMGLDYFKRHHDVESVPYTPLSEIYENPDGTYTIRVYVWVYDGVTEHSGTCTRYVVDSSGKGEETLGMGGYVDLTQ